MNVPARLGLTAALLAVVGCSGPSNSDAGSTGDGGANQDSGSPPFDAGNPPPPDAGNPTDAGPLGDGGQPNAFTLGDPADPTVSTHPTLGWTISTNADTYSVEVSLRPDFATDVDNQALLTNASYYLNQPIDAGAIYYWRVTAVNAFGSTVASNAPGWFSSPVDAGPSPHGVAVTPNGSTAVVINDQMAGTATLIDLSTFATRTVPIGAFPSEVAITPDGTTALVVEGNKVAEINVPTADAGASIASPCVSSTLYGIAVLPNGSQAVMPDFNAGCVSDVLDLIPLPGSTVTSSIPLSSSASAFGVAVTPDSTTALVTRGVLATSVRRVDLGTQTVTTIPNTSSTYGVGVTPGGTIALVSSGGGDTIKLIDLTIDGGTVVGSINYGSNSDVGNLAISPDGGWAVVAGSFDVGLLRLGPDAGLQATYPISGNCVAITPDGTRALATGAGPSGLLYVFPMP